VNCSDDILSKAEWHVKFLEQTENVKIYRIADQVVLILVFFSFTQLWVPKLIGERSEDKVVPSTIVYAVLTTEALLVLDVFIFLELTGPEY
jgi:hypothetical protein